MTQRWLALVAGFVALASGCSSGASSQAPPTAITAATTVAPPTTAPPTSAAPSTTAPAPSTTEGSTLPPPPEVLPTPAPVPPDGAREPEVVLGTIEIPKIGLVRYLYEGITLHTLDKGPGHWPGTALPGHVGNAVVGGHRTSKDRPFRHLDQLVPGDEIIYQTLEGRFVYRVTGTTIVDPYAFWITEQTNARTTTLFACHPPGSTRQRIVVFAELVV
jgi:sortase A